MTGYLGVTAAHVRELSATQGEVGAQIKAASAVTSGVSSSMLVNHGIVCSGSIAAVAMAHSARQSACSAMASMSSDLSEKLGSAAGDYEKIDQAMGDRLGQQMHPR